MRKSSAKLLKYKLYCEMKNSTKKRKSLSIICRQNVNSMIERERERERTKKVVWRRT